MNVKLIKWLLKYAERTMITSRTKNILVVIIDFNSDNSLEAALENTVFYLKQYTNAKEPSYYTVNSIYKNIQRSF